MKRFFLLILFAVSFLSSVLAQRNGTMMIRNTASQYDTLIHRSIGPGVTYSQFQFNDIKIGKASYKMRTHLLTIDMSNPYNRISPYLSDDTYYEYQTQEKSVAYEKKKGLKPFASVNSNAFAQSHEKGDWTDLYEVYGTLVSDGKVWYENDSRSMHYYTDASGKGNIGSLQMKATITSSKGVSVEIGQINHYRNFVRNTPKLALFCNGMRYAKDTNTKDGVEVFLKGEIKVGKNQLTVEDRETGCGSYINIKQGLNVITGVGDTERFLNDLEIGETVTIEITYTDGNGLAVVPSDTYTSFMPDCVKNGTVVTSVDASKKKYAIPAIGVSKDGNTVYLADLEISDYSNAPICLIEDLLVQVGAWNAFYHDGGPSAEMTVDGKFVTNNSIGAGFNGRYIPCGVMVYSTAPDDNEITSLECSDISSLSMVVGDKRRLNIYAYNQYGEMIDDNVWTNPNVEISCSSSLGYISEGEFYASNPGSGYITFSIKGKGESLKIPVSIIQKTGLIVSPNKVFTGEGRPVQLSVKFNSGSEITSVDPSKVSWSVSNRNVVSSCKDGLIIPYVDGTSVITASYKFNSASVMVEVENLEEEGIEYIDLTEKVKSASDINQHLPSVPHSIYIETRSFDTDNVSMKYTSGLAELEKTLVNQGVGTINRETITLDYDAADTYPVSVKSVSPASTEILRLIAVYTGLPSGINDLYVDETSRFEFSRSSDNLTMINCSSATGTTISVYSFNGIKLAEKQVYLSEAESCTLDVKTTEPIIVRVQTKNGVQVFKLVGE